MRRPPRLVGALAAAAVVTVASPGPATVIEVTERISVGPAGTQADSASGAPAVSGDGDVVAFVSSAANLVVGDTNAAADVFVHVRSAGTTTRVSVGPAGTQADAAGGEPSVSGDGRLVAFSSTASNLVGGDLNGRRDVFVHDRATGQTRRASVDSFGVGGNHDSGAPAISADGRFVAFESKATNLVMGKSSRRSDVFVRDLLTGQTTRVSVDSAGAEAGGASTRPAISTDGRFVAFESVASNLVASDTNATADVFVHDRQSATTARVSVDSSASQGNGASNAPAISADGRFVAFESVASNLVASDTNATADVFVHWRSQPPGVPDLVAPEPYGWFLLGEDQDFTVRAVDPEGDDYRATVTVTNRSTGAVVTTFATPTVASGADATASPPADLPPGEYRWRAVAVDVHGATGPLSSERVFGVGFQPNRPPSVPALLEPGDGQTFFFGQPEAFSVNSVDPDGDLYSAIVTVTNVDTGDVTTFQTRPTASGTDSRGRPVAPLLPGNYRWGAQAVDGRGLAGDPSGERAFEVRPAGFLV